MKANEGIKIDVKNVKHHKVVSISGILDLYNIHQLKTKLQNIIEQDSALSLVLNLESLRYIDSSGIALLTHLHGKILKRDGHFSLMNANNAVLAVLQSTTLNQFFTFTNPKEL